MHPQTTGPKRKEVLRKCSLLSAKLNSLYFDEVFQVLRPSGQLEEVHAVRHICDYDLLLVRFPDIQVLTSMSALYIFQESTSPHSQPSRVAL